MESRDRLYFTFKDVSDLICDLAAKPLAAVLLASPEDPDADSCASMFAFKAFLAWLHGGATDCFFYAPNKPRQNTLFERIKPLGDPLTDIKTSLPEPLPSLVISFDYGQFSRMRFNVPDAKTLHIGFDHHQAKDGDTSFPANGVEVRDPVAPSTTALLYRFFAHTGFPISPALADCLLVGLLADTGKFTNNLTSPEALEIGAALMRCGGDYQGVLETMRVTISAETLRAQLKARDKIIIDKDAGIGFLSFSRAELKEWGLPASGVFPLFGLIQSVNEVRLAAMYSEREDGAWYCSLRSTPKKGVNAKAIAQYMGGGGHDYAAGFVSNEPPDKILQKLKDLILEAD